MSTFRIHPAIGIARVGNSDEYYLAPETLTGVPVEPGSPITGGLPIRAGTESTTITSSDLRDAQGRLKRQAARFRIYAYAESPATYPYTGQVQEVQIGTKLADGRVVKDIIWNVHLANKKANWYLIDPPGSEANVPIISLYADGKHPAKRNPSWGELDDPARLKKAVIDPGPRVVHGINGAVVDLGVESAPATVLHTEITHLPDYPQNYPDADYSQGRIVSLGGLTTDAHGRLVVIPADGRAAGFVTEQNPNPVPDSNTDSDGWLDNCGDGPVSATLVFEGGLRHSVDGAWVITTDPAYAPQILNSVSLWDDIYDTFVRQLGLRPDIYAQGAFNTHYQASFDDDVRPFFRSAALQEWIANLPEGARRAHRAVGAITEHDQPADTIMSGLAYVRNPNIPQQDNVGAPLMPLSLGDSGSAFMEPSVTQYFFLQQWDSGQFKPGMRPLSGGENLDRAALVACLGGRFSPGIDMTFICRQTELYEDWKTHGPFRIRAKHLDYKAARKNVPFLGKGYVPLRPEPNQIEPGDLSKFMSIPWQTDYNSCATHPTSPNELRSTTLYWSWPAQRPVAVFLAEQVSDGKTGDQRYSVRGPQTESDDEADQGRYQDLGVMLTHWPEVGTVIQGTAIDGGTYPADYYLEVQSQLPADAGKVDPWPLNGRKKDVIET